MEITIVDKTFGIMYAKDQIQQAVYQVAVALNNDYQTKTPLFVVVLQGAFMFASDLLQNFKYPCEVAFVKVTSYDGLQQNKVISEIIGLSVPIVNRHVVIVEDIVDTGNTVNYLLQYITSKSCASVTIASLFFKPNAFIYQFPIDYVGIEISNDFIVGYGLDYLQQGRNFPDVYKLKEA